MQICSNQFQLIRVVWYALDTALNTTTFIVFKDLLKAILRALLKEASKGERNPTPALDLKTNLSMQCIPSKGLLYIVQVTVLFIMCHWENCNVSLKGQNLGFNINVL